MDCRHFVFFVLEEADLAAAVFAPALFCVFSFPVVFAAAFAVVFFLAVSSVLSVSALKFVYILRSMSST